MMIKIAPMVCMNHLLLSPADLFGGSTSSPPRPDAVVYQPAALVGWGTNDILGYKIMILGQTRILKRGEEIKFMGLGGG